MFKDGVGSESGAFEFTSYVGSVSVVLDTFTFPFLPRFSSLPRHLLRTLFDYHLNRSIGIIVRITEIMAIPTLTNDLATAHLGLIEDRSTCIRDRR